MADTFDDLDYETYAGYIQLRSPKTQEATLRRYWAYVRKLGDWLARHQRGTPLDQALGRYRRRLTRHYGSRNSLIPVFAALNWAFRVLRLRDRDGESLRLPLPAKAIHYDKAVVTAARWQELEPTIRARTDLKEYACVLVLRDTGLRPSDIVQTRLTDVRLEGESPRVELTSKKNEAPVYSRITRKTAALLQRYLRTHRPTPTTYLFESEPGQPYERRWPWWILRQKAGLEETPTTFRRSLATLWDGDVKDLQLQGGWKTSSTIDLHYKQPQTDRHNRDYDRLFEPKEGSQENEDDVAYG